MSFESTQVQHATPFRHPVQSFVWSRWSWDIAVMIADIDSGKLRPKTDVLERAFIESYATRVLALDRSRRDDQVVFSLFMQVDLQSALALPPEALQEPVILLETHKGKGLLRLEGRATTDHILADGQHRIAKAFHEDVPSLPTYLVSAVQARRYALK